jgi:hypothetical protein
VNPLIGQGIWQSPDHLQLYRNLAERQALGKSFFGGFPQGVESEENPRISRFLGAFGRASPASILNFFFSASALQGGSTLTEREWTSLGSVH